jgi:hypothetical protein
VDGPSTVHLVRLVMEDLKYTFPDRSVRLVIIQDEIHLLDAFVYYI